MRVQFNMFILMLSGAFKSSSDHGLQRSPEGLAELQCMQTHFGCFEKVCDGGGQTHFAFWVQVFAPLGSSFWFPSPVLVSNKTFAAVITKNINCPAFDNPCSCLGHSSKGVPSLFICHIWRLEFDKSFFWVIPRLLDCGCLFVNFPICLKWGTPSWAVGRCLCKN